MHRDAIDLAEPAGVPLALPPHPPGLATPGFPWLATVAPVVGAVVLWTVTGSALSLAFAALGPVVAVASVFDARRQGRRARRVGAIDRAERLAALRAAIATRHAHERAAAWRRAMSARAILEDDHPIDWRDGGPGNLVLGRGTIHSSLRVDGTPVDVDDHEVMERAARLDDAPVLAPVVRGIGVVGRAPLARSLARALLVQLAHRYRPGFVEITVPPDASWSWATALPHRRGGMMLRLVESYAGVEEVPGDAIRDAATIALAEAIDELPPGLETIVVVESPRCALVERRGDGSARHEIVPDLASVAEAGTWAAGTARAALREGVGSGEDLPDRVSLESLAPPPTPPGSRDTLRTAVGVIATGQLELDLVTRGPHAIVAGTTGSGKSEFLLAWLTALARCHPPDRVSFLLVDFKGGAAFEPIRDLPHVTGIVTDLDESEAERAILSLRAELRHRESVLAAERVRDIVELAPHVDLPRLVLVVDEFQAMIERFPDLGVVVADIAARGRSLGVHLILASQRPNGVVREQVTANCPIRVSLRVMQRTDSIAVVGTDAAASIGPETPGRGVVDAGDGRPVPFQSARVDPASIDRVRRSAAGLPRARRPWVGPLPERLTPAELDAVSASTPAQPGALALGLADEPDRQRHDVMAWTPSADGHLLVLGGPGSGRSTALAAVVRAASAVGAGPVLRLDGSASAQWDALLAAVPTMRRGEGPRLVTIDDLDVRFRDWPDEYRHAAYGMVEAILRDGRSRGVAVAATAGSALRLGAGIRELFSQTILMRHPSRTDLVQAGGAGGLWRPDDPAGSGQWRGRRVQFADVPGPRRIPPAMVPTLALDEHRFCAIVTSSPRADAVTLRATGHEPMLLEPTGDAAVRAAIAACGDASRRLVVIGDVDAWTANWPLAAAAREESAIVVHGGRREYRVFARGSTLPPLLDDPIEQCWVLMPDRAPRRSMWPLRADN